jgi:hypothetical protein
MSIHLLCGNVYFHCQVSYWNKIRESISRATNVFLLDYLERFDFLTTDDDKLDENEKEKVSLYKKSISAQVLKERLSTFSVDYRYAEFHAHPKLTEVGTLLVEYLKLYNYYLDLLTVLGVNGVYPLLNKSDIEGFYSIGNSIDIINTINIVYDFVEDDFMKSSINECKKIFEASVQNNMIVAVLFEPFETVPTKRPSLGKVNPDALKRRPSIKISTKCKDAKNKKPEENGKNDET